MAVGDDANSLRNNKSKRDVLIVRISLIVLGIILIGLPAFFCLFPPDTEEDRDTVRAYRKAMITVALESGAEESDSTRSILNGVELVEKSMPNGQPYYVGEIKSLLDLKIPNLVEKYNTDADTEYQVSEEEVRFGLTEGLHETVVTGENEAAYRLRLFFNWCNYQMWAGDL